MIHIDLLSGVRTERSSPAHVWAAASQFFEHCQFRSVFVIAANRPDSSLKLHIADIVHPAHVHDRCNRLIDQPWADLVF